MRLLLFASLSLILSSQAYASETFFPSKTMRVYNLLSQPLTVSVEEVESRHYQTTKIHENANLNSDLILTKIVEPAYPLTLKKQGKTGYVIVSIDVNEMGHVDNPQILEHKGHSFFKRAAITAVKKFEYTPKYKDGKPQRVEGVKYKINFALDRWSLI